MIKQAEKYEGKLLMGKKKIILLNSCKGLYGGVEAFLLNVFRYLDKDLFEVHFLTCGKTTYGMYEHEIIENGGVVEEIAIYPDSFLKQMKVYHELSKYFRKEKPEVVHINSSALSFQLLASLAAEKEGVQSRILHSHNYVPTPSNIKSCLKSFFKPILSRTGTRFLACSKGAALWMFTPWVVQNKAEIIPNGIDTKKFLFDKKKRDLFRQELGIGEQFVIGNIGRFQKQKNHPFIISVFEELLKYNPLAILLLVGEGELKKEIQELVKAKGMEESVFFLGERNDMDYFLSAIDVFIFPSLFEGFGIAALEAQASGAGVFLSDTIPTEVNVTGKAKYLSINDAKLWAKELAQYTSLPNRRGENHLIFDKGYDLSDSGRKMQQIYLED